MVLRSDSRLSICIVQGTMQAGLHTTGLSTVTDTALPESGPTHIIIEDMSPTAAVGSSQQLPANLHDLPESALVCQVRIPILSHHIHTN